MLAIAMQQYILYIAGAFQQTVRKGEAMGNGLSDVAALESIHLFRNA
jgi:hypothetical protein